MQGSKLRKGMKRLLECLLVLGLVALFLTGSFLVYDTLRLMRHAQDPTLQAYRPKKQMVLEEKQIGPEEVCWITIEDTGVDFPVMQSTDNIKYLQTDPYGDFSMSGSIFLDCRNAPDFTDPYSIIYGHHMEQGLMFGALDDFRDAGFAAAHRKGQLTTCTARFTFQVFCTLEADAASSLLFRPCARTEVLEELEKNAFWYETPGQGRIVALSTCTGTEDTTRFLVVGAIEEQS